MQASLKCRRKRPSAAQTERETVEVSFLIHNVRTNQRQLRYLFNNVSLICLDTFRRESCPALTQRQGLSGAAAESTVTALALTSCVAYGAEAGTQHVRGTVLSHDHSVPTKPLLDATPAHF